MNHHRGPTCPAIRRNRYGLRSRNGGCSRRTACSPLPKILVARILAAMAAAAGVELQKSVVDVCVCPKFWFSTAPLWDPAYRENEGEEPHSSVLNCTGVDGFASPSSAINRSPVLGCFLKEAVVQWERRQGGLYLRVSSYRIKNFFTATVPPRVLGARNSDAN